MKITEMSFPGLHEYIFKNFFKNKIKKDSKILILGSGEGAFENRLLREGYTNISSVDLYTNYKLGDKVKHIKINLNDRDFGNQIYKKLKTKFDVVVSIEIIEHTYSMFNFLENGKSLLNDKGIFLISTPNVHSFMARVDKVLTGYPTYFIADPEIGDHVSPVYENVLVHFLKQLNMKISRKDTFGTFLTYLKIYDKKGIKSYFYLALLSILYVVLNPFMILNRKKNRYSNSIYVLASKNKK